MLNLVLHKSAIQLVESEGDLAWVLGPVTILGDAEAIEGIKDRGMAE